MKPSADGRSASLIIQGLDSSMHALGHNSKPAGSTTSSLAGSTQKGAEAVPRFALASRGAMLLDGEREAGKIASCWRSAERTSLVGEAWVGSFAGCMATGKVRDQQVWPLVSGVLALAVLSREEHCSRGAASSVRSPKLPSKCHVRGDQQEAHAVSLL